ncbi:exonuclease SbcCD subunit D [Eubacteriales bacterium KG127]
MRLAHLADLHIGKKLYEHSLIDNQRDVLDKIINLVNDLKLDGIMISGDIYDRSMPSLEAVILLDEFLTELNKIGIKIFVISGNHDSQIRLSFGAKMLDSNGIYISSVFSSKMEKVVLEDRWGKINFYLLPYIRPINVRKVFENFVSDDFTDAIKFVIDKMNINKSERNILICHQFVTGAITSDSEEVYVGGSENVDYTIFDDFDYVALGHLHKPQSVGRNAVRYAGTPLKYSFSEISHVKSLTVVEIAEKGNLQVDEIPLIPMQDVIEVKGSFDKLTSKSYLDSVNRDSFVKAVLTDEIVRADAINHLRKYYPYILYLSYENRMTERNNVIENNISHREKNPKELIEELFLQQNNRKLNITENQILDEIVEEIWRSNNETN